MNFAKIFNAINKCVVYSFHYVITLSVLITLASIEINHQIRSKQWDLKYLQAIWNLKHFPIVAVAATGFVLFIFLFMFMLTKLPSFRNATKMARLEVKKRYGDFMMLRLTNEIATMENKYLRNVKPSEVIALKNFFLDHRDMRNALEAFERDAMGRYSPCAKNLLGSFESMYEVLQNKKEPMHSSTVEEGDSTDDYAASDNDEFGYTYIYGRSRPFNKERKQKKKQAKGASNDITNQQLCHTSAIEESCNESSKKKLTKTKSTTKIPTFELTQDEITSNEIRNDEANFVRKLTAQQILHTPIASHKATLQDQSEDETIQYNITNEKLNKNQTNQHLLKHNQTVLNESNEDNIIDDNKSFENEIKTDPYQKVYNEMLDKIEKCTAIENGTIYNPLVHVRGVDDDLEHSNRTNDDQLSLMGSEKECHNQPSKPEIDSDNNPSNKISYLKLHCPPVGKDEISLSIETTADINDDHIINQYDEKSFDNINQSKTAHKKSCLKYKITKNSQNDNKNKEEKIELKKTKGKWDSIKNNQKEKQYSECIHQQKLKDGTQVKEKVKYSEKYKHNAKVKQEEKGNEKKTNAIEGKKTQEIGKIGDKLTKDEGKYKMNIYKDKPKTIKNYTKNEVRAIISREKTNIVKNYLRADAKVKLKDKINSKGKAECNSKHKQQSKILKNRDKEDNSNNTSNIKMVRFKENDNDEQHSYISNDEAQKELNNTETTNNKRDDGDASAGYGEVTAENQEVPDMNENHIKHD